MTDENAWVDLTLDLANTAPLVAGDAGAGSGATPADAGADAATGGGDELLPNDGLDKSQVAQAGLQIGALGGFTGSETIRLLIDSVTFDGIDESLVPDRTFDDGPDGFGLNDFMVPPGTVGPTPH